MDRCARLYPASTGKSPEAQPRAGPLQAVIQPDWLGQQEMPAPFSATRRRAADEYGAYLTARRHRVV
jgi:hypothetical protein